MNGFVEEYIRLELQQSAMRESLRAGIAIYNDGYYHAAHDAWEDHWLDLESGTKDELLLHGLIQFTAAIYHAHNRNWDGTTGLASSALEYLEDLPDTYRGVDCSSVRKTLDALASDPEVIERRRPPKISYESETLTLEGLDFAETGVAALVLAEEFGYEEEVLERGLEYARTDLEAGKEGSQFITLSFDFVREDDHRAIVFQRLSEHVQRRKAREEDVEGLF